MRILHTSLVCVFVHLAAAGAAATAWAASPAYCALYAREYFNLVVPTGAATPGSLRLQDQAYYRCLNQDEDPALPASSVYFELGFDGGLPVPAQGDASEGDEVLATEDEAPIAHVPVAKVPATEAVLSSPPSKPKAAPKPPEKRVTTATRSPPRSSASGYEPWTPEWDAWCRRNFPNSFNPRTGMIVTGNRARSCK